MTFIAVSPQILNYLGTKGSISICSHCHLCFVRCIAWVQLQNNFCSRNFTSFCFDLNIICGCKEDLIPYVMHTWIPWTDIWYYLPDKHRLLFEKFRSKCVQFAVFVSSLAILQPTIEHKVKRLRTILNSSARPFVKHEILQIIHFLVTLMHCFIAKLLKRFVFVRAIRICRVKNSLKTWPFR